MSTSPTSSLSLSSLVAFLGGALLAFGIALTFIPRVLHSAFAYDVPDYSLVSNIGSGCLVAAAFLFVAYFLRTVSRTVRKSAVR